MDDDGNAAIRVSLRILALYLGLTFIPLLRWSAQRHALLPALAHLVVLAVIVGLVPAVQQRLSPVRAWAPLATGPFLYLELRWLIPGFGQPHHDAIVSHWEALVFPSDPSRTLAIQLHFTWLSEILHLCYVSYYALIYVPPALLWLRGERVAFAQTVLALVIVYAVCFGIFVLFPVDGPRYVHGPASGPAGVIRSFVLQLLERGSAQGTAFPSSHVAASVVAGICALRFDRGVGALVVLLTAGLTVGAVYGGFHYGVDAVAGLITGLLSAALARAFESRLRSRATSSASSGVRAL